MKKIISWNVNGVRAAVKKGMLQWLEKNQPDILCIQETKAQVDQLDPELINPAGYKSYWQSAERKGYSGVATFVKKKPLSISILGKKEFDSEGRVQILTYEKLTIINAYFPNSQEAGQRLDYKLGFCKSLLAYCNKLKKSGKNVLICGDFNIAHKEIDLKNPKTNMDNPGFLPEERAWMDKFIKKGYVDTFRIFNQGPGHYTWWSYRFQARKRNIGWRIDYNCVNEEFKPQVKESIILKDVLGSDHCPVMLRLK